MTAPIRATRLTALASGVLLALALPALDQVGQALSLTTEAKNIAFLFAMFVFFFVPVLLFVAGVEHLSLPSKTMLSAVYWSSLGQVAVRAMFWMLGGGIGFGIHSTLGTA